MAESTSVSLRAATAMACLLLAACNDGNPPPPAQSQPSGQATAGAQWSASADAALRGTAATPRPRAVPGEYLVKFRLPTSASYAMATMGAHSFHVRHSFRAVPGLHHVEAQPGADAGRMADLLAREPGVEYVEPNFIVHAAVVPNDPQFGVQWALSGISQPPESANLNIEAVAAWDITTGSRNVVIGVIDTGVDYTHEDLAGNVYSSPVECTANGLDDDGNGFVDDCHGINAITRSGDPMDDHFHGTHVAGTIGALGNNGIGVAGVNWNVTLLPCKFLDSNGSGNEADAITCLDYLAAKKDAGLDVVASNNSWGGSSYSQGLLDAIRAQRARGILFIAAAGNDGLDVDQTPDYPCSFDLANVICVAASMDGLAIFSNYGNGTVHLAAPGEWITSTVPRNGYDTFDGTSMATPHVSGVAALLAAQDPSRDWRTIRNLLLAGTVPATLYPIHTLTGGRLDALRSMTCTHSEVLGRMRPGNFEPITLAPGASLRLEALHIDCAAPAGAVTVTVDPGGQSVTLADNGVGDDEVAGDGIYAGRWTAPAAGSYTLTFPGRANDTVNVVVDGSLVAGFPLRMANTPDYLNGHFTQSPLVGLVVGNMDADPAPEILSPGYIAGPLYAWKANGTQVPGWPNYAVYGTAQVSLGHFDPLATALGVATSFTPQGLRLFGGNGRPMAGWPQPTAASWLLMPTADLDGDGLDEVVGYPARHADGSLANALAEFPARAANDLSRPAEAAVADLDGDALPDVIEADNLQLYASNVHGLLAGFPVPLPASVSWSAAGAPAVGDVDGDGRPNIILPVVDYPGGITEFDVLVLDEHGRLLRTLTTPGEGLGPEVVTLADLDGDGLPEIVASSEYKLHVWKADGSELPGWPQALGATGISPVAVGDLDGDGQPDLALVTFDGWVNYIGQAALHVLDRQGRELAGFPRRYTSAVGLAGPAIADLLGNGHNILVASRSADFGERDNIYAYDLHGTGSYGGIEWSQHMGGPEHRGYYEAGKNLAADAFLALQPHGAGAINSADGQLACGTNCMHRYRKGSVARLTATPAAGATFTAWLGACAGQGNPCTVTASKYTRVAADFASPVAVSVAGDGSVSADSGPIRCPSGPCTGTYAARTTITLTANPGAGSAFAGWSGDCAGITPTCTVAVERAVSVGARFTNHWNLSIVGTGTGHVTVVSSPAGLQCGPTCTASFAPGTVVTLTATRATDTYIAGWGVPACASSLDTCTLTLDSDVTVALSTSIKPMLTLAPESGGSLHALDLGSPYVPDHGIDCPVTCTMYLEPVSVLDVRANPDATHYFTGWGGDCSGTGLCTIAIGYTPAIHVSASFAPLARLTINVAGTGGGLVSSGDGVVNCTATCSALVVPNTTLTLTESPAAGSTLAGWSGMCSGTGTTCTVTVAADATVGVSFTGTSGGGTGGGGTSGGGGSGSAGGGGGGGGGGFDLAALAVLLAGLAGRMPRATRRRRLQQRN